MRVYFRYPGVEEFQVRNMTKNGTGEFSFAIDTSEIAGASFDYYLEAELKSGTAVLPQTAPKAFFTALSEGGESVPEVPSDLPTAAPSTSKVNWPVNVTGSIQGLLHEKNNASAQKDVTAAGNTRITANYKKNDLEIAVDSNVSYSNLPVPGERSLDLSNMVVSVSKKKHLFKIGDINISESEFTVQGLGRRGLEYAFSGSRFSMHLFDVSTQQARGFDGFGMPKAAINLFGGALGWKLFSDAVSLKAVFLTGKDDPRKGVNVSESYFNATGRKGNVIALSEETNLFRNAFTVGGEFARSDYDGDISDENASVTDNAWRIGAAFRSGSFQLGTTYRHIGKGFNPIGYQFFVNDREGVDANVGFSKGRISLMGAFSAASDNVEGKPEIDTTKNMSGNLNLVWNVTDKVSLNFGYRRDKQSTARDEGEILFPQDSLSGQLSGSVMMTLSPSASMSIQIARSSVSSKASPQGNNSGLALNVGGTYQAGTILSIAPLLGFTRARNSFTGERQLTYNSFLTADVTVVPNWLSTNIQAGYSRSDNGSLGISDTANLTGALNLHLQKLIKVGNVVLSIRGNYGRTKMTGFSNTISSILAQCDFSF